MDLDEDLAESLKIEANHNRTRVQSFANEVKENRIFDQERERGLGEYLEDQERWDLLRERGLQEYRATKRDSSPREGSPEYQQYLEERESQDARYERSRRIHIQTREKINTEFKADIAGIESEELGLHNDRPRYQLRKRSANKWVNASAAKGRIGGSPTFTPGQFDYQPPPEFPAAPAPYEPPPEEQMPPTVYDQNGVAMPVNPENPEINIPPPPPPPPDFDF